MAQPLGIRRAMLLANVGLPYCAQHRGYAHLPEPESEKPAAANSAATVVESQMLLVRLYRLIQRLNPADRQIITLYLEGLDAASIGEVTGISAGYAATKIHRIKRILADRFSNGGEHDNR